MRCGWQEKVIIKHQLIALLEHKREHVNIWDFCLLFGNSQRFFILMGYIHLNNIAYWLLMNNITRRQPFAFRTPLIFTFFRSRTLWQRYTQYTISWDSYKGDWNDLSWWKGDVDIFWIFCKYIHPTLETAELNTHAIPLLSIHIMYRGRDSCLLGRIKISGFKCVRI
mgnify:FL=1